MSVQVLACLFFALGLPVFGQPGARASAVKPELIFYAPCDGTADAAWARGDAKPVTATHLVFVKGVKGQAVHMTAETKSRLEYRLEKNVDPLRGTIAFWYKPGWDLGTDKRWRHLFGLTTPWDSSRVGSGAIFLWYFGPVLRGETSDKGDSYITARPPVDTNSWQHIAFTWDEEGSELYINGKSRTSKRDNFNPLKEALQEGGAAAKGKGLKYDRVKKFSSFHVGCARDGKQADGLIDELKIYSAPLAEQQVLDMVSEYRPVTVSVPLTYFLNNRESAFVASVSNLSDTVRSVAWQFTGPNGAVIQKSANPLDVTASKPLALALALPRTVVGCYSLDVSGEGFLPVRKDLWVMDATNPAQSKDEKLNLQLVETLLLDKEPASDRFVSTGGHTVQSLNGVRYLEAGTNRNDRFAVRMRLPDQSPLYCFEWSYPDDKLRTADIIVQSSCSFKNNYELQVGYATGGEYPSQNKMLTARCLYWAPTQDVSVVFMTAKDNAPAAVSQIRLYKVVGGLPAAKVNVPRPVDGWNRTIGLYYEDPAINYDFCADGARMPEFETLINRTAAYMKYSGQDLFAYPGVWYHGLIGEQYNPRGHAENFLEAWFTKFDQEGLGVMPTFNQQTLPLPEGMIISRQNLSDGSLYDSCVSIWDSGMPNPGGWHGTPPNFNILHPYTQRLIMRDLDAMLAVGVSHPSFKGFDLRLAEHCFHWLGGIRAGYNDYMIDAFTRETGIQVPVDRAAPLRGKRYAEWLLANVREEWVNWRCRAVAQWYKRLAARLAQARPDLRLSLTCITPLHLSGADFNAPGFVNTLNKEAGIDASLYADTPNIIVCQASRPAQYRAGYDKNLTEAERLYLREAFNRQGYYDSLTGANLAWVHMHDHYWESAIGDPARRGKGKALDAPWFKENTWRVTTINPASYYALRPYVMPLRYHDVLGFTKGGFLIGTYGMEDVLVPFARAFRALPAKRFEDVAGNPEAVKLRMLQHDGKTWFYAVNTGDEPAALTMKLDTPLVTDLLTFATPSELSGMTLTVKLQPYQLRSFSAPSEAHIAVE